MEGFLVKKWLKLKSPIQLVQKHVYCCTEKVANLLVTGLAIEFYEAAQIATWYLHSLNTHMWYLVPNKLISYDVSTGISCSEANKNNIFYYPS